MHEMRTIDVHGQPIAHELRGRGVPIVLICGTGYPGATWPAELVEPLLERHSVLIFDHRGTGSTPASAERLSTRLFAKDAVGLMDALGLEAAHIVGHSMGGRVAQWMALDRPERIRSLILAATGPGQYRADKPVTRGIPLHAATELIEQGYERYMREHIEATFFTPEFAREHPEVVGWLVNAFWRHRPDVESYLRHIVARQEHQTADRLGELLMATLVLIGDRDTQVMGTGSHTEQSAYLIEHLPNATQRVIEGAAHGYFWQMPQRSAEILLDWTARH
ncbi:MAG TPA: alpha/beta fold hydrolase [Candidatus Limnocylindria bacterium]|nr:alpha/beta fold hydrolase [Candidatus Limnocylindria bacterium]